MALIYWLSSVTDPFYYSFYYFGTEQHLNDLSRLLAIATGGLASAAIGATGSAGSVGALARPWRCAAVLLAVRWYCRYTVSYRGLVAMMLLAVFAFLPTVAQAQNTSTFVSTTGQARGGLAIVGNIDTATLAQAQQFTTGDEEDGYTLSEIVAKLEEVGGNSSPRVSIFSDSSPSGYPGSSLYVLTNPTSLANGSNTFAAPANTTLARASDYWVVFENTATGTAADDRYSIGRTTDYNGKEDAGTASGWSIANLHYYRTQADQTGHDWGGHLTVLLIAIKGATSGSSTTTSTDATLDVLEFKDASGNTIELSPMFVSTTTSYTALVANAVDEITIAPAVGEMHATVAYLGGSDTETDDANTAKDGQQVSLSVGANTIKVKVTADDGFTTETYTVVVTRAAAPGQVTGVTVTPGTGRLTVTWDVASNADGYKVQWKSGTETFADAATDSREATVTSGSTASHTITGLTNGTAYEVQVIATRTNADDGTPSEAATGTPVAEDETPPGVTLSVNPAAVAEDAGGTVVTVTAELADGTRSAATTVAVTVGSGSAGLGTDFMAVNNFNVTIPGNAASGTGTFTLNPVNDTVDEPDETVLVMGTVPGTDLGVSGASVTITDNDAAPAVTLLLSQGSIGENGGTAAVTASLNRASSAATTVEVTAAPAGAVMPSVNTTLRFEAESVASTGTVMLTAVDNDIDAANLTVTVSGAATNSQGVTDPADLSLTITDDDTRGVTVSKSALTVDEGGTAAYTVVLNSQPAASVTVTPLRSSGDSDVTVSGPLTFTENNWDTPRTLTVSAAEDSDTLDDTAVIGHTLAGGDYAGVTAADVEVTVTDGETTPVTGTGGGTPVTGTGGGTTPVTPPAAVPAPTGLEATEGANGIVLNWSAPAATTDTVDGYIVNRCEGAGCIPEYYYWVPSGTTYTDRAVMANTLYRYSVSAYFNSSDKTSDSSNVIERTMDIVGAEPNYRDQVQIMYVAYYGRPGDAGGLDFWATELEKVNGNLSRIINSFGNSEEFQDRFGDLDNEELVNNIYLQLLGRDADSGGLKFYVNGLREGRFTLASIALNVANGTQNLDEMIKVNKLRAANAFTEAYAEAGAAYGEFQIDDAKLWLAGVDSTSASITAALDSLTDLLEMFPEAMPPAPAEPVLERSFIENINILKSSIRISPGTRVAGNSRPRAAVERPWPGPPKSRR